MAVEDKARAMAAGVHPGVSKMFGGEDELAASFETLLRKTDEPDETAWSDEDFDEMPGA